MNDQYGMIVQIDIAYASNVAYHKNKCVRNNNESMNE